MNFIKRKNKLNEISGSTLDKYLRVFSNRPFCELVYNLKDPMGNKKAYCICVKLKEDLKHTKLIFAEYLIRGNFKNNESPSGTSFAVSNMQCKPSKFTKDIDIRMDDKTLERMFDSDDLPNYIIDLFEENIEDWLKTGVYDLNSKYTIDYTKR